MGIINTDDFIQNLEEWAMTDTNRKFVKAVKYAIDKYTKSNDVKCANCEFFVKGQKAPYPVYNKCEKLKSSYNIKANGYCNYFCKTKKQKDNRKFVNPNGEKCEDCKHWSVGYIIPDNDTFIPPKCRLYHVPCHATEWCGNFKKGKKNDAKKDNN